MQASRAPKRNCNRLHHDALDVPALLDLRHRRLPWQRSRRPCCGTSAHRDRSPLAEGPPAGSCRHQRLARSRCLAWQQQLGLPHGDPRFGGRSRARARQRGAALLHLHRVRRSSLQPLQRRPSGSPVHVVGAHTQEFAFGGPLVDLSHCAIGSASNPTSSPAMTCSLCMSGCMTVVVQGNAWSHAGKRCYIRQRVVDTAIYEGLSASLVLFNSCKPFLVSLPESC